MKKNSAKSKSGPDDMPVESKTPIAPRTPAEELIADIYASELGVSKVGVHDDLVALGINSQLAAQMRLFLQQTFHVDITTDQLLLLTTIDGLINLLSELWGGREIVEEIAWTYLQIERLSDDEVQSQLMRELGPDPPKMDSAKLRLLWLMLRKKGIDFQPQQSC